jgi:hypothetical protein
MNADADLDGDFANDWENDFRRRRYYENRRAAPAPAPAE